VSDAEPRCAACAQPFGTECAVATVTLAGESFERVPLGSETAEWWVGRPPDKSCHDCATTTGQRHHVGCDMEQCPRCGNQAITCDCD
jgi:hypothetical protein